MRCVLRNGIIVSTLLLGACAPVGRGVPMETILRNDGNNYDVSLALSSAPAAPGDTATLRFSVRQRGFPVDLYAKADVLHVTVASENLRDFRHYFGEMKEEGRGVYSVRHAFTHAGKYHIWLDIPNVLTRDHHGDNVEYRGFAFVDVPGEPDASAVPETLLSESGSIAMRLVPPDDLASERPVALGFSAESADPNVRLVPDIDHFYVIVAPAFGEYRLEHVRHGAGPGMVQTLPTTFPAPGPYLVWGEFYVQNMGGTAEIRATQATFIVDVPPGTEAE